MPEVPLAAAPQAGTHGLQILNAQKEDAGQYTCVVTNELGEAMKNYHVEVLSESGPPGTGGSRRWLGALGPGAWAIPDTLYAFMGLSALIVARQRAGWLIPHFRAQDAQRRDGELGLGPRGCPPPLQSGLLSAVMQSEPPQLETWGPQRSPQEFPCLRPALSCNHR